MTTSANTKIVRALAGDFALDNWYEHRVDRATFTIYVGGDPHKEGDYDGGQSEPGVEHHMADRLEMALHVLSNIDPRRPILIVLSSCGGEWEPGMQMFAAILACPNPVTIYATKHARSMTSLIPLAADRFLIRPPAQFMFHYGTMVYEGLAGEEFTTVANELNDSRDMMLRIYVERLKEQGKFHRKHPSLIRNMLEEKMRQKVDVFLSTDEAVEWGFADGVVTGPVERAAKKNVKRRNGMWNVLRKPRNINFKGVL